MRNSTPNINIYSFGFYAVLFGCIAIIIGHPLEINILVSLGTYIIAGASLMCAAVYFSVPRGGRRVFLYLALLVLATVSLLITSWISYYTFIKFIVFLEIPTFLLLSDEFRLDRRVLKKVLTVTALLLPLLFLAVFRSDAAYKYNSGDRIVQLTVLTLNYSNPNETALYLFFYVVIALTMMRENGLIFKIILFIECTFVCWLIVLTQCRAIEVMTALVLAVFLFNRKLKVSSRIVNIFVFSPVVFMLLTLFIPTFRMWFLLSEEIDTGRFMIYTSELNGMTFADYLFGCGGDSLFNNFHNSHLSVLASIGLPSLVVYIYLIRDYFMSIRGVYRNKTKMTAAAAMLVLLVHGCVEAAVWVSGSVYAAMFLVIMCIFTNFSGGEELE